MTTPNTTTQGQAAPEVGSALTRGRLIPLEDAAPESGRTPGPWRIHGQTPGAGTDWVDIVTDSLDFQPSYIASALQRNARLIAAAPALLAFVRKVERDCIAYDGEKLESHPLAFAHLREARAAIAQAEKGEAQS